MMPHTIMDTSVLGLMESFEKATDCSASMVSIAEPWATCSAKRGRIQRGVS
jgi:hypothetical protein